MATAIRGNFGLSAIAIGLIGLLSGCCGPMACGPMACGTGACGSCSSGPLLAAGGCGGCGNCDGCGERYYDEWINHPPTCDPCDSCGNHNGQSCMACRPVFDGIKSLWGYRRDCGCDGGACGGSSCDSGCSSCDGGCSSCGGHSMEGAHSMDGGHVMTGEYEVGDSYIDTSGAMPLTSGRPSPAPQIVEAKPSVKPFQPQRTRQIFKPKGTVATAPRPHSH